MAHEPDEPEPDEPDEPDEPEPPEPEPPVTAPWASCSIGKLTFALEAAPAADYVFKGPFKGPF